MISRLSRSLCRVGPSLVQTSNFLVTNYSDCCGAGEDDIYCMCSCGGEFCLCGPPKTRIGLDAPDFTAEAVVNGQFKEVALSDYEGKWLCLNFYPLDFTFVCPTEILAFNDALEDFQKLDCEVLMTSVDSKFSHLAWTNVPRKEGGLGAMQVPLVSDLKKTMSRDYGVLNEAGISFRGTFLIDPDSKLRQVIINDLPIGRNVDEVIRLLEACQFFDENGEVCPAGWTKGDDSINVENPGEYFEKQ